MFFLSCNCSSSVMHILLRLNHVLTVNSWERESALKCCLIFHMQYFYHPIFVAFLKSGRKILYDLEKMRIFYTSSFGSFSQFLIKFFILREIVVCNFLIFWMRCDSRIDSVWFFKYYIAMKKLSSATCGCYNRIDWLWFKKKKNTFQFF